MHPKKRKHEGETSNVAVSLESEVHTSRDVVLSKGAAQRLKGLMKEEGKEGWTLRFSDEKGHCGGGYGLHLALVEKEEEEDLLFHSEGIQLAIPGASEKRLGGSRISYREGTSNELFEGLLRIGFTIDNPNIKSPCACACQKGYTF